VPGISSIYAAPGYAGIPVTHRDFCSGFTVITGHEDPTKPESSLDYAHLARTRETLVILMGVERIGTITGELIANGMAPDTPVSMTRWGTTGKQKTIIGTLESIAGEVARHDFKAPAVTVIGGVVSLRDKLNWFEKRPLFGRRVVVTRTRQQASQLSSRLRELGADILEIPTIRTAEPDNKSLLKDAFSQLGSYEWIVFTSPNGVEWFFSWFFKVFKDIRAIGGAKIAAVGPATARKLEDYHLQIDAMPRKYVTDEIVDAMKEVQSIENVMVLLMRAQVANPDLPERLMAEGAIVDDIPCYKTVIETEDLNGAAADMEESGADWVTFTSSSTVEHFHDRFDLPALLQKFPSLKTASIGPETTKALLKLNLNPTVEAVDHTIPGLVKAVKEFESDSDGK
jgi:uroporphyrinogen III methyltransferase/synthase